MMSVGFVFWLLMILWLVFDLFMHWPLTVFPIGSLLLWILLALLGWKVFGFPIHG